MRFALVATFLRLCRIEKIDLIGRKWYDYFKQFRMMLAEKLRTGDKA